MIDLGSLNDQLGRVNEAANVERSLFMQATMEGDTAGEAVRKVAAQMKEADGFGARGGEVNALESAGPISDAYILGTDPMMLITGPGGSGKTTASTKKALLETSRIYPGADGVRRYVLGAWRQKYDNLWAATIPSWWKLLPQDLPGSTWVGARPRAAEQIVRFKDSWGDCILKVRFRAFGESMDPEDILGNEQTDAYLNEMSTMPEALTIALVDRVGRDPPRAIIRRTGRIFGDANAPDVLNYCYRDFYELPLKDGYRLFRQPGGLDVGAENLNAMGREYYENSARVNAHRPWWVKRMVHARPGFTRDADPVYDAFDDDTNMSPTPLEATRMLPIVVGIDAGYTPSAVYTQVVSRQARILGEVVIERGGMRELAQAMLEYEARRFARCEFNDFCDPSMGAGEDIGEDESDRTALSGYLARSVSPARTNMIDPRTAAVKEYLGRHLGPGRPGLLVDPSCKSLRRGFNQTYHYKRTRGSNDISSIEKTPDSHPHDGLQYAALAWGTDAATMRASEAHRAIEARRQKGREQGRRNPLARRA
jgi:hypothetical protein